MSRRVLASIVVLASLALAACGSSGGGSGVTKAATGGAVTVVASDIKFYVGKISASAGPLS